MGKLFIVDVPQMLNMWDFEKNNEDPSTVSINSSKRFFWTCKKCGKTEITSRFCPDCGKE